MRIKLGEQSHRQPFTVFAIRPGSRLKPAWVVMRQEDTLPSQNTRLNRTRVLEFHRPGLENGQPSRALATCMAPDFAGHRPGLSEPTREGSAATSKR